jgi:hypothetical protein
VRTRLAQRFGETHLFTAQFQAFSTTKGGAQVACFERVCIEGEQVTDHIWIHRSKHMKTLNLQRGDIVEFEARVERYPRRHRTSQREAEHDYNLEKIKEMRVIKRRWVRTNDQPTERL